MTDDDDDTPGAVITRADLRVAAHRACPDVSREEVRKLLDDTLEEISDALIRDETVKLSGFGVFKVRSKPERIGRNPRTGVEAVISSRRVISFKPSPALKELVNGECLNTKNDE
jgi:integration host factor subunit alpha